MKVFIRWSGDAAREFAVFLQQLLRRLDSDLAQDRISVEDYRRLRDELLAQVGSTPRGALPR